MTEPSSQGKGRAEPYQSAAPKARYAKAIGQMIVGATTAFVVVVTLVLNSLQKDTASVIESQIFYVIGIGLAVAAAFELAYTLFTDGPDEAIDPITLGLAAAVILQLAKTSSNASNLLTWQAGLATVLFVLALGGLIRIRKGLAIQDPENTKCPRYTRRTIVGISAAVIVVGVLYQFPGLLAAL
jgi:hypothetical protein